MTVLDDLPDMLADLAGATECELGMLVLAAVSDGTADMVEARVDRELRRRELAADRARSLQRANAVNAADREAWRIAAHAQYLAAEAECNGELVNAAGVHAGVPDGFALWRASQRDAERFATEELRDFWAAHERLSPGRWRRGQAAGRREARDQAPAGGEWEIPAAWDAARAEPITIEPEASHEQHEQHGSADSDGGARVDVAAQAGLRRERAADPVRPGPDGQQHARPADGPVRDAGPVRQPGRRAVITYADPEAEPLDTEFNWEDRFPRGAVVLVAGWRESAKGLLTWNITAAATNGRPLPGEAEGRAPADVIMISAEDDLNEDKAWRARAAGVRLERVHDMTHLEDGSPFELSASKLNQGDAPELLAYLRQLRVSCMCGHTGADAGELAAHLEEGMDGCEARNPRWVFMDPLNQLVMDGTIKTDQGARRLIGRLERVARLTGVTIVIIHHFVKSGSIGGSQGLVDAPRWVYEIQPDPAAPDCKVIHTHKCNKGGAPDIRYRIVRDGHNSRIEWVQAHAGAVPEERSWRGDDLAARRAARAATPAEPAQQAPAMMYAAVVKITGRPSRLLARGVADAGMARRMCEQSPEWKALAAAGKPLAWQEGTTPGQWAAGHGTVTFAVAGQPVRQQAV